MGDPPPRRRGRGLGRSAGSVEALGRPEQARPRGLEGAGQPMPRLRSRKTPGLLARGLGRTKPLPARSLVPAARGASANVSLQSRPQLQPGHNTRAPEVTPGPPISRPVPAWDEGPGTSLPPGLAGESRCEHSRRPPSPAHPGCWPLSLYVSGSLARGTAVITTQGHPPFLVSDEDVGVGAEGRQGSVNPRCLGLCPTLPDLPELRPPREGVQRSVSGVSPQEPRGLRGSLQQRPLPEPLVPPACSPVPMSAHTDHTRTRAPAQTCLHPTHAPWGTRSPWLCPDASARTNH